MFFWIALRDLLHNPEILGGDPLPWRAAGDIKDFSDSIFGVGATAQDPLSLTHKLVPLI